MLIKSIILVLCTMFLSGCGNNMEFDRILGAKTEAYAEIVCKDNHGYYTSMQILKLDVYFDGYVDKIEIVCYDGLIQTYDADYINEKHSPRVAELLKQPRYNK